MTDLMRLGAPTSSVGEFFRDCARTYPAPDVLELGTLRWEDDFPTHHQEWVPHAGTYVMSDVKAGTDVDVVADAHDLTPFEDECCDLFIAVSVWEHLARPWIAAQAAARVLRPGGYACIATHHAFPVHGYPDDYTRWTTHGLAELFASAGLDVATCGYAFPCQIIPPRSVTRWNKDAPAFLNVEAVLVKPSC